MNKKTFVWQGKHLSLVKTPGEKSWVSIGNSKYYPVTYEVQGPPGSRVPNKNGVAVGRFGMGGPVLWSHEGRIDKAQLAEVIEFAKAIDAAWQEYEDEARLADQAERIARQKQQDEQSAARDRAHAEKLQRERLADGAAKMHEVLTFTKDQLEKEYAHADLAQILYRVRAVLKELTP